MIIHSLPAKLTEQSGIYRNEFSSWYMWIDHSRVFLALFAISLCLIAPILAEDSLSLVKKGDSLIEAGDYQGALDAYDQAIALTPDYFNAWIGKAYAQTRQGNYSAAIESYEAALAIQPNSTFAWRSYGYVLGQAGQNQEALAAFETAIQIDPRDSSAWVNKGLTLSVMGRFNESIQAYQEAIRISPSDFYAWFSLGVSWNALGNYDEALSAFDSALAIDPRSSTAWNQKGLVLSKMGRYQEAIEAFQRGLIVDPGNTELEANKAAAVEKLGAYVEEKPLVSGSTITLLIIGVLIIVVGGALIYFIRSRVQFSAPAGLSPQQHIPGAESGGQALSSSLPGKHHDIFVSYSHVDKPVADAICATLESRHLRCWIAPRDILPGISYPNAIIEAIEGSRIMILVFSSHSNTSPHVIRELSKAISSGVVIIPFRIEGVDPSKDMEYLIGVPHWLDALTPPLERHLTTLADTVALLLNERVDSDAQSPQHQ
jgi:tetratricopeptide (TPR) repeat protein